MPLSRYNSIFTTPHKFSSLFVSNPLNPLRKLNDIYLISSLIIIGLLLRLPSLRLGLWGDEGSTYFDILPENLGELIQRVVYSELNPPGYYLIMHQWMQWFGAGEVVFKIPVLIFGLLLIPVTYALGRVASSRQAGVIAAAITTFAESAVYYSQEARPYSLTALLCCLVVLMYCKAIVSKHQIWYLVGFVLCATLLLYVQYTGLFLIASLVIMTLYLLWRRQANVNLMPFAISFGIIFLLFMPWLQFFLIHQHTGTPWMAKEPWWMRPKLFFHSIIVSIPINNSKIAGRLFVLFILILGVQQIFSRSKRSLQRWSNLLNPSTVTLSLCFVIPAIIEASLSLTYDRYIFPFLPIAWVLYGICLTAFFQYIDRRWRGSMARFSQRIAIVLLIFLLVLPNSINALSLGNGDKSGIRALAADLVGKHQEKTIYVISPDYMSPTFGYYFAQNPVPFYAFGRWDHPEIFSPQGYAEIWANPKLVSDIEQRLRDEVSKGYRKLALVQKTDLADMGKNRYSQGNKFLSRLKQTYPLLETKNYPGKNESVTVYLFALDDSEDRR